MIFYKIYYLPKKSKKTGKPKGLPAVYNIIFYYAVNTAKLTQQPLTVFRCLMASV